MQFLKNKPVVIVVFLLTAVVVFLNEKSTQFIGINYSVTEYEIPLYLKLYNFYGRHLNYDYLVNKITKNSRSDKEKVISISKWINSNIKKLPNGIEVVDSHPLTIAERRLGTKEQFSDLLSVMLVYADIDSFFWFDKDNRNKVLTFFRMNGYWSVIDPYYGIVFINNKNELSSIGELKSGNWQMFTLNSKEINSQNINNIFNLNSNDEFSNISSIRKYYSQQIHKIPTRTIIDQTNLFDLGGRSYIQSPSGRIKYIVQNKVDELW